MRWRERCSQFLFIMTNFVYSIKIYKFTVRNKYHCGHHAMQINVHTPPYNFVMLYICRNSKIILWPHFIQKECCMRNKREERAFQINGVRDVTCVNVQLMHLAGPREVCVCITYSREAWIEGPTGGVVEIAREMRVVQRERDEYDVTTRDSIPLSVYMQGGGNRGTRRNFLCVWCLCWYVWV